MSLNGNIKIEPIKKLKLIYEACGTLDYGVLAFKPGSLNMVYGVKAWKVKQSYSAYVRYTYIGVF